MEKQNVFVRSSVCFFLIVTYFLTFLLRKILSDGFWLSEWKSGVSLLKFFGRTAMFVFTPTPPPRTHSMKQNSLRFHFLIPVEQWSLFPTSPCQIEYSFFREWINCDINRVFSYLLLTTPRFDRSTRSVHPPSESVRPSVRWSSKRSSRSFF